MTWTLTTMAGRMTAPRTSRTSLTLPTYLAHKDSKGRGLVLEALDCRTPKEKEDLTISRVVEGEVHKVSVLEARRISKEARISKAAMDGRAGTTKGRRKASSMEDKEMMIAGRIRTAPGRESSSRAREGASEEGACLRTKVAGEWVVVTPVAWAAMEEAWALEDLMVMEVQAWIKVSR